MTISEQIKVLVYDVISVLQNLQGGDYPPEFQLKNETESFTISDLEYLAETLDVLFERYFVLPDGEKI